MIGCINLKSYLTAAVLSSSAALFACQQVRAQTIPTLVISPKTCIVNQLGEACNRPMLISWQAPHGNYCLYNKNQRIKCWQGQSKVAERVLLKLTTSSTFELKSQQQSVVAKAQVTINGATSKHFRRRLRADWSVF